MTESTRRLALVRAAGPSPTTLGHLVQEYVTGRLNSGRIEKVTSVPERYILGAFAEVIGWWKDVHDLTSDDIQKWLAHTRNHAPGTRRHECSKIRAFCRWLEDEGYVEQNPAAGMKLPRKPRSIPRALPSDLNLAGKGDHRGRARR
jgi:site-specific recombinase XerD